MKRKDTIPELLRPSEECLNRFRYCRTRKIKLSVTGNRINKFIVKRMRLIKAKTD